MKKIFAAALILAAPMLANAIDVNFNMGPTAVRTPAGTITFGSRDTRGSRSLPRSEPGSHTATSSISGRNSPMASLWMMSSMDKKPGPVLTAWLAEANYNITDHHDRKYHHYRHNELNLIISREK